MTTDQTIDQTTADTAPSSAPPGVSDDPRVPFAEAVAQGAGIIAAVRPEQMAGPTPCDLFDVRGLLGHLLAVLRRVAVVGAGGNPHSIPDEVDDGDDTDWSAAWTAAAADVHRVWADAGVLDRIVHVPWADMPGRDALAIYVNELTVHTWDLAVATDQRPAWDEAVVATALAAMTEQMPAEGRHEQFDAARAQMSIDTADWPDPFLAVVAIAEDATPIEHLVAFNGRDPRWSA